MKRYGIIALPAFLFFLIFLLLHALDPQNIGPAGILLMFVLIYLFFLSLFTLVLFFGFMFLARYRFLGDQKRIKPQKAYYLASVAACFPVFLLAIMSIGELKVTDVLLVGFFVLLASLYVARRA